MAELAARFLEARGFQRLGYARVGDYARERLGIAPRQLRELSRMGRRLRELPLLGGALAAGAVSWSAARLVARVATPADEAAWLAVARTRPASELARMVRAVDRGAVLTADAAGPDRPVREEAGRKGAGPVGAGSAGGEPVSTEAAGAEATAPEVAVAEAAAAEVAGAEVVGAEVVGAEVVGAELGTGDTSPAGTEGRRTGPASSVKPSGAPAEGGSRSGPARRLAATWPRAGEGDGTHPAERRCGVRVRCTAEVVALWWRARRLASRVAGESLSPWQAVEWICAEVLSAVPPEGDVLEQARRSLGIPPELPPSPGLQGGRAPVSAPSPAASMPHTGAGLVGPARPGSTAAGIGAGTASPSGREAAPVQARPSAAKHGGEPIAGAGGGTGRPSRLERARFDRTAAVARSGSCNANSSGKAAPGANAGAGTAGESEGPAPVVPPRSNTAYAGGGALPGADRGTTRADPFALDRALRAALAAERRLDGRLGALLAAAADAGLHRRAGFSRLDDYVRERLDLSPRKARALLRLTRLARRWPRLQAEIRVGRLSWVRAQTLLPLVAFPVSPRQQRAWVDWATRVTVRRLEEDVERALLAAETAPDEFARSGGLPEEASGRSGSSRPPSGPAAGAAPSSPGAGRQFGADASVPGARVFGSGASMAGACDPSSAPERGRTAGRLDPRGRAWEQHRFFFVAPADVAALFRAALCTVRRRIEAVTGVLATEGEAAGAMFEYVLGHWEGHRFEHPESARASERVFARDGWRCAVPGCSSMRNLHDHHVTYRSQGGGNELSNRVALCAFHHLRGEHGGLIRVRGRAPEKLRFELGLRPGGEPLERFASGDLRLGGSARAAGPGA